MATRAESPSVGETRPHARGSSAVASLPRGTPALARVLPSGRSLVVAFGLVAAAVGAYFVARETPMFAVRRLDISGAPPAVAAEIRRTLSSVDGSSLLALDGATIERRLSALPDVASSSYDRAFPHTLRIFVVPERPVGVLRRGADAWVVSARARVIAKIAPRARAALPRVWVAAGTAVGVGQTLTGPSLRAPIGALVALRGAGRSLAVRAVRSDGHELTLLLRSGLEVRLGNGRALALKLAVAQRIAGEVAATGYLDVSVPERPVFAPHSRL